MAVDGLTTIRSTYGPRETIEKLQAAVKGKGMTVFAEIDHAAGAAEAGLALRPTGLLMFGHARGGTPLMQAVQTIGVAGRPGDTWLSYNEPGWLAKRHGFECWTLQGPG